MELQVFTYDNLKSFTNDFHDTNFIGKFQFGRLFHGMIGSQPVTVKIWEDPLIYRVFYQDNEQRFKDEISFLSHPTGKHPNLLNLIGYCYEGENLSVVYDVKALGILHDLLLKDDFTWLQRIKAALGFAFLLERLHEESTTDLPYLLRNIGAVNIMLDQDYNPKLCDFGMISGGIFPDRTHVRRVRISGCYGYIDPFYAWTGEISEKSDVFAFGVILLNLIAKRIYTEEEREVLAPRVNDWAKSVYCPLSNCSLVHQSLQTGTGFYFSDGVHITELAMQCVEREPWNRPTMSEVLNCLLKLHVVHGHAGFMGVQQKVRGHEYIPLMVKRPKIDLE